MATQNEPIPPLTATATRLPNKAPPAQGTNKATHKAKTEANTPAEEKPQKTLCSFI